MSLLIFADLILVRVLVVLLGAFNISEPALCARGGARRPLATLDLATEYVLQCLCFRSLGSERDSTSTLSIRSESVILRSGSRFASAMGSRDIGDVAASTLRVMFAASRTRLLLSDREASSSATFRDNDDVASRARAVVACEKRWV